LSSNAVVIIAVDAPKIYSLNYVGKSYSDITDAHDLTGRRYLVANAAGAFVGETASAMVNLHANF
jgi:iron complex outermembrane receptor protein